MSFFTYIMASGRNGTIYTGSTDDLHRRYEQHRHQEREGFTAKYKVTCLVWFETHGSRREAFRRERSIKEWRRSWKIELIEEVNPTWRDLGLEFGRISAFDLLLVLKAASGSDPPALFENE